MLICCQVTSSTVVTQLNVHVEVSSVQVLVLATGDCDNKIQFLVVLVSPHTDHMNAPHPKS